VSDDAFWNDADGETLAYFTPDAGFVDDPQLAAHNFMNAAARAGATFAFRTAIEAIETAGGRISGVRLANGDLVRAAVVVNASGPYSSKVNAMAGVLEDFSTITTRALRQEVHVVESPPDYQLDGGAVGVNDTDLGVYFRPQPGGSVVVGGLEPDCDPLVFVDDPDIYDEHASVAVWEAQVYRLARRIPSLAVPSRPVGLGALYDVTPDWVPLYDRTSLDGYYVAIGTSGNQFKNAPMVGRIMSTLIGACEDGHDHDNDPVRLACEHTGHEVNLGHFSRRRVPADTTHSVLG
jgi:sarcosine oxidase subunit beta